jgi:hypothetical protein
LNEYPILLHFPLFPVPGYLEPAGYTRGINLLGTRTISFGPKPEEVIKKYGATGLRVSQNSKPVEFARVIAKVAYSLAVAEGALELIEGEPFVCPAILGGTEDIGKWVGTVGGVYGKEAAAHTFILRSDLERRILIGEVRLFADSQAPAYCVVLGRLRKPQSKLVESQISDEPSLQFVHCLVCDSVQIESKGKITIAGFFGITPDVNVIVQSHLNPVKLTFVLFGRGVSQASRKLKIEVKQPTGWPVGEALMNFGPTDKVSRLIVKLDSIMLPEAGEYTIRVCLEDKENYRTTFRVILGQPEDFEQDSNPA